MAAKRTVDNGYELPRLLKMDKTLSEEANSDKKMELVSLANIFEADLAANLLMDSIDLAEKYPEIPATQWQKFLRFPVVNKFIEGFLKDRAEKMALKGMGQEGLRAADALRIKQEIDSQKPKEYNQNIVVMFLPKKRL